MIRRLYIINRSICLVQRSQVRLEIIRPLLSRFNNAYMHIYSFGCEHAGYGETIATIVALTTKDMKRLLLETILQQPLKTAAGRGFHEVDRLNRLVADGIAVPIVYLLRSKN